MRKKHDNKFKSEQALALETLSKSDKARKHTPQPISPTADAIVMLLKYEVLIKNQNIYVVCRTTKDCDTDHFLKVLGYWVGVDKLLFHTDKIVSLKDSTNRIQVLTREEFEKLDGTKSNTTPIFVQSEIDDL